MFCRVLYRVAGVDSSMDIPVFALFVSSRDWSNDHVEGVKC